MKIFETNWVEVGYSTLIAFLLSISTYVIGAYFEFFSWNAFSWIEFLGVLFNYICVILTARQNIISWPTGIIAVLFLGILFWNLGLYSSLILSIGYFLPVQFIGWYNWLYGGENKTELKVSSLTITQVLVCFSTIPLIVLGISQINGYFGGTSPVLDTIILTLSVLAQYLLALKKIESWILWMIVNIVSIYVYTASGAYLLGVQYALFLMNAFYGFYSWSKKNDQ